MRKLLIWLLLPLLLALPACSSSSKDSPEVQAIKAGDHVVIDVRTPAEFESGHVKGAQNIDVQSPDFMSRVSELPKDGQYVLYCRSGNRSKQAQALMKSAGFTTVLDAGGFEALKSAGVATE